MWGVLWPLVRGAYLPVGGNSPEKYKAVCEPTVDLMDRQLTVWGLTYGLNNPVRSPNILPAGKKLHFQLASSLHHYHHLQPP